MKHLVVVGVLYLNLFKLLSAYTDIETKLCVIFVTRTLTSAPSYVVRNFNKAFKYTARVTWGTLSPLLKNSLLFTVLIRYPIF